MIHQFDHRWAPYEPDGSVRDVTLAQKQDPKFIASHRTKKLILEINGAMQTSMTSGQPYVSAFEWEQQ